MKLAGAAYLLFLGLCTLVESHWSPGRVTWTAPVAFGAKLAVARR